MRKDEHLRHMVMQYGVPTDWTLWADVEDWVDAMFEDMQPTTEVVELDGNRRAVRYGRSVWVTGVQQA